MGNLTWIAYLQHVELEKKICSCYLNSELTHTLACSIILSEYVLDKTTVFCFSTKECDLNVDIFDAIPFNFNLSPCMVNHTHTHTHIY